MPTEPESSKGCETLKRQVIKKLTGGGEITTRSLYKESFEFLPYLPQYYKPMIYPDYLKMIRLSKED